jgi:hypothetical protein
VAVGVGVFASFFLLLLLLLRTSCFLAAWFILVYIGGVEWDFFGVLPTSYLQLLVTLLDTTYRRQLRGGGGGAVESWLATYCKVGTSYTHTCTV